MLLVLDNELDVRYGKVILKSGLREFGALERNFGVMRLQKVCVFLEALGT